MGKICQRAFCKNGLIKEISSIYWEEISSQSQGAI